MNSIYDVYIYITYDFESQLSIKDVLHESIMQLNIEFPYEY